MSILPTLSLSPQVFKAGLDTGSFNVHTAHTVSLPTQVSMAELDAERKAEDERLERQQQEKMQRRRELHGAVLQVWKGVGQGVKGCGSMWESGEWQMMQRRRWVQGVVLQRCERVWEGVGE